MRTKLLLETGVLMVCMIFAYYLGTNTGTPESVVEDRTKYAEATLIEQGGSVLGTAIELYEAVPTHHNAQVLFAMLDNFVPMFTTLCAEEYDQRDEELCTSAATHILKGIELLKARNEPQEPTPP